MAILVKNDHILTAGETIVRGDLVKLLANGTVVKAVADSSSNLATGFAFTGATVGNMADIMWSGFFPGLIGLVPGAYYLSQSVPGTMTNIRPTSGSIQRVGFALSATELSVDFEVESSGDAGAGFDPGNEIIYPVFLAATDGTQARVVSQTFVRLYMFPFNRAQLGTLAGFTIQKVTLAALVAKDDTNQVAEVRLFDVGAGVTVAGTLITDIGPDVNPHMEVTPEFDLTNFAAGDRIIEVQSRKHPTNGTGITTHAVRLNFIFRKP